MAKAGLLHESAHFLLLSPFADELQGQVGQSPWKESKGETPLLWATEAPVER